MSNLKKLRLGNQLIDGYNYQRLVKIKRKLFKISLYAAAAAFLAAFANDSSAFIIGGVILCLLGLLLYWGSLDKLMFGLFLNNRTYV